jgi:gamma-glutamylcyclotransferase (GGCT)/AIG2-like uncharacterized protein YtfP
MDKGVNKMLYFAYGSNLNVEHMRHRCPRAKKVGRFTLPQAKLVFRGVADVIFHPTEKCVGGLWEITRACERALDRYEGVSAKLYRKVYLTIKRRGQPSEESVLVYVMNSDGIMPPFDDYLAVIERGYRDFGLDLAYLGRAVEHAYEAKDRTPDLERRYERKGRPRLAQRERRAS